MLKVEEHEYMYELSIHSLVSLSVNLFLKKLLFREKGSHHNGLFGGRGYEELCKLKRRKPVQQLIKAGQAALHNG